MYKKHCSRCFNSSFSSCITGEWLCPVCRNDLTHLKAIVANNQLELNYCSTKFYKQEELFNTHISNVSYKA